jgi:hypothetical protein
MAVRLACQTRLAELLIGSHAIDAGCDPAPKNPRNSQFAVATSIYRVIGNLTGRGAQAPLSPTGRNHRGSAMSKRAADLLVETLQVAGVKTCYGIVGDTMNRIAHARDLLPS